MQVWREGLGSFLSTGELMGPAFYQPLSPLCFWALVCFFFFCCWVCSPLPRVIDKVEGGRRGSGIEDEGLPWPGIGHVARFQVPRFPSMVCAKAGCLQLRRMRGTGCCLGHRSSCEHSSPGTWFSLSLLILCPCKHI